MVEQQHQLPVRQLNDLRAFLRTDTSGRVYVDNTALDANFAASAIEVDKTKPTHARIWRTLLAIAPDGRVIDLRADRKTELPPDVRNGFSRKNAFDRKESETGDKTIEMLLDFSFREKINEKNKPRYFLYLSPSMESDNGEKSFYESARLGIGQIKEKMGHVILEQYGIPVELSPHQCFNLGIYLEEFAKVPFNNLDNAEDLRGQILEIIIPEDENWIEYYQKILPGLEKELEEIKLGEIARSNRRLRNQIREDNKKNNIEKKLLAAKTKKDFLVIGAQVEKNVQKFGYDYSDDLCGLTNSTILKQMEVGGFTTYTDTLSLWRKIIPVGKDKFGSLEFTCPNIDCGKTNTRKQGELNIVCEHCGKYVPCTPSNN